MLSSNDTSVAYTITTTQSTVTVAATSGGCTGSDAIGGATLDDGYTAEEFADDHDMHAAALADLRACSAKEVS